MGKEVPCEFCPIFDGSACTINSNLHHLFAFQLLLPDFYCDVFAVSKSLLYFADRTCVKSWFFFLLVVRGFHNEVLLSSRGLWCNFIHLSWSGCVREQSLGCAPCQPTAGAAGAGEQPGCVCDGSQWPRSSWGCSVGWHRLWGAHWCCMACLAWGKSHWGHKCGEPSSFLLFKSTWTCSTRLCEEIKPFQYWLLYHLSPKLDNFCTVPGSTSDSSGGNGAG